MNKDDYLKASFDNIQSLIQFTDQKVAAVLVVVTITTSIFITKVNNLSLSLTNISILGIAIFITGFAFCILNTLILYIGLIKIIRPSFAKHYNGSDFSLFYFDHIAIVSKNKFIEEADLIDQSRINKELADQLFEVSKILSKKNRKCNKLINLLFLSIVILILYNLLTSLT